MNEPATLHGIGNVAMTFFSITGDGLTGLPGNPVIVNPSETTCYVLKGVNAYGCRKEDTICVQVMDNYSIYLPNTFTPNADNLNDVFVPIVYGFKEVRFTIFNRWGAPIYSGDEHSSGWDGNYKGKRCETGVYIFHVEAKTMTGKTITRTGHVTLLAKADDIR